MKKSNAIYLYILFFIALIVECFLILKAERLAISRHYEAYKSLSEYRLLVRPVLVLSLFPLVFKRFNNNFRGLFLYFGLLTTWLADVFVLTQQYNIILIGITLYTCSYIFLTASYQKLIKRTVKKRDSDVYIYLTIWAILVILLFALDGLKEKIGYALLVFHIIMLIRMVYVSIKLRKRLTSKTIANYIIIGSLFAAAANIIYGISTFKFNNNHPSLDVLTAFCYGLFLFFSVFAMSYMKENQQQKSEKEKGHSHHRH